MHSFHGAHLTVNSVCCHQARSKMGAVGGISPGKKYQLLWRVGLAVRLMELNGGVVSVRAVQTMMMGPVVRVIVNSRK
jgi:hypothetical protein